MTEFRLLDDPLALHECRVTAYSHLSPADWIAQQNTSSQTLVAVQWLGDQSNWLLRRDWARPHPGIVVFLALPERGSNPLQIFALFAVALFAPWAAAQIAPALGLGAVGTNILAGVIGIGASALISQAFQPPTPKALPTPSATYSSQVTGNQIRLGESIEIQYGEVTFPPAFVQRPYVTFQDDNEYLCLIYSLGFGSFDIRAAGFGAGVELPLDELTDVSSEVFQTSNALLPNVSYVAADVQNLSLDNDQYTRWAYPVPRFAVANRLQINVQLPGLFSTNDKGDLLNRSVVLDIQYQRINNTGQTLGEITEQQVTIRAATVNLLRRSFTYDLATAGRYQVRIRRTNNPATSTRARDNVSWHSVVAHDTQFSLPASQTHYALKIKATGQLSGNSTNQFYVKAYRQIDPVGNALVKSYSPYLVAADMLRARYGLNTADYLQYLPDKEDLTLMESGRGTKINPHEFHHRFESQIGLMEAIATALAPVYAKPYLIAGRLHFAHDTRRDSFSQVFAEGISQYEHSRSLTEHLQHDGLEVVFWDARYHRLNRVMCQVSAQSPVHPATLQLSGIVDANDAYAQGMHQLVAGVAQRHQIAFETDQVARIPEPLEKVLLGFADPLHARTSLVCGVRDAGDYIAVDLLDDPSVDYARSGDVARVLFRRPDGQRLSGYTVRSVDQPDGLSEIRISKAAHQDYQIARLLEMQAEVLGQHTNPAQCIVADVQTDTDYFEVIQEPGILARVLSIEPGDGHKVKINCVRDEPLVYQAFGHAAEHNPEYGIPPQDPDEFHQIDVTAAIMPIPYPTNSQIVLRVSWAHVPGATGYIVDNDGQTEYIEDWNETFITVTDLARRRYVRVTPVSDGSVSLKVIYSVIDYSPLELLDSLYARRYYHR